MESILKEHVGTLMSDRMHVKGDIPRGKLAKALKSYELNVEPSDVLVYYDDTAFRGGKDGLIVSKDTIYAKELWNPSQKFFLDDIKTIELKQSTIFINNAPFVQVFQDLDAIAWLVKVIRECIQQRDAVDENALSEREPTEATASVSEAATASQKEEPSEARETRDELYELVKPFISPRTNFFRELKEKPIMRNVGGILDVLEEGSQIEGSDACPQYFFKREQEHRAQINAINKILNYALSFGRFTNQKGDYYRSIEELMDNERVTLEIVILSWFEVTLLLIDAGLDHKRDIYTIYLFEPIVQAYEKHLKSRELSSKKSLRDVVSYQREDRNGGEVSRHLNERWEELVNLLGKEDASDDDLIAFYLINTLTGVVNRGDTLASLGDFEEQSLQDHKKLRNRLGVQLFQSIISYRKVLREKLEELLITLEKKGI